MSTRRPKMIGAHVPKPPANTRRKPQLYCCSRDINAAFDAWTRKRGHAHLTYQRAAFGGLVT